MTIRYTLDGTEPQITSPIYEGPFVVNSTTVVKAKMFKDDKTAGLTGTKLIQFVDPAHNGLHYRRYDGVWEKLPDFSQLNEKKSGKVYHFALDDIVGKDDLFAAEIFGWIRIDRPGLYTFYSLSNDGSRLYINDKLVVDNDGPHGAYEKSGSIFLPAGKHTIRAAYFQAGGGMLLKISYSGPDMSKREVPADVLFTNP